MQKILIILGIIAVVVVVGWLLFSYSPEIGPGGLVTSSPIISPSLSQTPDQSKEIEVFLPTSDTKTVGTKFIIYGKGRAFENTFNYRISDDNGVQLYIGSFMANAPDSGMFGYFHQEVDLAKLLKSIPSIIQLDVYEASAKDGSDIHKTSWKLNVDHNSTAVFTYFSNNNLDPEDTCEKVYALPRLVPKTQSVLSAAINELLKSLTIEDRKNNFHDAINSGVVLNSSKITGSTAYLDFNNRLNEVGGSCKVTLIRRQIESTAKQFSNIKNVIISVNGSVEDILQP